MDRSYALFVGDNTSDMAEAVSRWCIYAKWNMAQCSSLEEYEENDQTLPGMLILESDKNFRPAIKTRHLEANTLRVNVEKEALNRETETTIKEEILELKNI